MCEAARDLQRQFNQTANIKYILVFKKTDLAPVWQGQPCGLELQFGAEQFVELGSQRLEVPEKWKQFKTFKKQGWGFQKTRQI